MRYLVILLLIASLHIGYPNNALADILQEDECCCNQTDEYRKYLESKGALGIWEGRRAMAVADVHACNNLMNQYLNGIRKLFCVFSTAGSTVDSCEEPKPSP